MKRTLFILMLGITLGSGVPAMAKVTPQENIFNDYNVSIMQEKIVMPTTFTLDEKKRFWLDPFGKPMPVPMINFAGHYFLSLHSCGMGCRYHLLHDLKTGKMLNIMTPFDTTENNIDEWRDKYDPVSLEFKPNSRLIIAKFPRIIDLETHKTENEYRYFIFDDTQQTITEITNTGSGVETQSLK